MRTENPLVTGLAIMLVLVGIVVGVSVYLTLLVIVWSVLFG